MHPRPKRARQSKILHLELCPRNPLETPASGSGAGRRDDPILIGDERSPPKLPPVTFVPPIRKLKPTPDERSSASDECEESQLQRLQRKYERSREELMTARAMINEQKSKGHEAVQRAMMQARQDVMLDLCHANDRAEKYKIDALRTKQSYSTARDQWEEEVNKLQKKLQDGMRACSALEAAAKDEKKRADQYMTTAAILRDELEHAETLQKTLEADLDELRQIQNVESEILQREMQSRSDLPPAYGSLDESEPALIVQEDAGAFDVASLKSTVRSQFMKGVQAAYLNAEEMRDCFSGRSPDLADSQMFLELTFVLCGAASKLRKALEQSEDMKVANLRTLTTIASDKDRDVKKYHRILSRPSFTADRVAKLMLDLTFRLISALEVRPINIRNLSTRQKAKMALAYTEVDDVLLMALRQGMKYDQSPAFRAQLWELQHYLTQVGIVQTKLRYATNQLPIPSYLDKTHTWLSDNVEKERQMAASAAADAAGYAMLGSDVSSEAGPWSDRSGSGGEE